MKVGKEDLIGILAAVEWYLRQDHEALAARYEAIVAHLVDWGRQRPDVDVVRETSGEAGQPTPRALIRLLPPIAGRRDEILAALRAHPPRVELLPEGDDSLYLAPETLVPGEEEIVTRRLGAVLEGDWWR